MSRLINIKLKKNYLKKKDFKFNIIKKLIKILYIWIG